jgi:hypothetical protein
MLKQGSNYESLGFKFGIKRKGGMFEFKQRFSVDIANFINDEVYIATMFITPVNNKNVRFIYGHCTELELAKLQRAILRGKCSRHMKLAEQYLDASNRVA